MARWVYGILLAGLVSIFAAQFLLTDHILARGDTFTFFYPYWEARNAALRAGELPLWSPYLFMGSPLLAEPQLGTYYPLNWLTLPFANAPDAVEFSVLLHLFLGAAGVFVLFAHLFPTRGLAWGALAASVTYMFSGNLLGHVEQVNQLQGLAWLGWLFWLWHKAVTAPRRWLIPFGMAWGVLFFIGHTQTVFIAGVGLGTYALTQAWQARRARALLVGWGVLAGAGVLGILLALPQFYPTLELTGMSNRGGSGLTPQQATAFSLPIHYLGRALLPNYDGLLFTEYIGYFGIVGMLLALYALRTPQPQARRVHVWAWTIVALLGLTFAFGRYNPLYLLLANFPPFNLFRVPARWLALLALGGAILAGTGLQALTERPRPTLPMLAVLALPIGALALLAWGLPTLAPEYAIPSVDIRGASVPSWRTLGLWAGALALGLSAMGLAARWRYAAPTLFCLLVLELWGASLVLPLNELAPRETYLTPRFTATSLQTLQAERSGRVLAISSWLFDVGDKDTLRARYEGQGFSEAAIQTAFTATKRQEMLAPNLPQTWRIASVDGYGGGLLPTMTYSQFTSLVLPPDTLRTVDGRIGEALARESCRGACLPEARWLDLMHVGYVITDKRHDVWHEGIAFDTTIRREQAALWFAPSPLIANRLAVLYAGTNITAFADDTPLALLQARPLADSLMRADYALPQADILSSVRLVPESNSVILGATLYHNTHNTFVELAPEGWQRVLSSDIKVYAREQGLAYAHVIGDAVALSDTWQGSEDALALMQQPDFDPARRVILHGDAPTLATAATGSAQLIATSNTGHTFAVQSDREAYVLLLESHYPHWHAFVNNAPAPLYRANVLFMAVRVPAGDSTLTLRFQPDTWWGALGLGAAAWGMFTLLAIVLWRATPTKVH